MVVEDDPDELNLLCDILQEEGFRVIGCDSAGKALEHVQQRDFGVAVVDYRLPDLSGTQLLERIRTFDDQVRVIIYTGVGSYDSVKEALNLGAFAYLEKLSDRSELLRHVHRACRERVNRYAFDLGAAVTARTEELARSNRELEDFASIVAHDLRSPLLTISGYCQLIQEDFGERLDATGRDYLGQIVAGAARMDRLIDDLLEYSRAGRSRRPLGPVNVQSVLAQATANLEASIRQREARIEIGQMPTVTGDQTQLVELFQNLIANAVKFCREETPWVRVSAAPDTGAVAFRRGRQRHRHRKRALRECLSDVPAAARPGVLGHGRRPGDLQKDRAAARRADLAGFRRWRGHHLLLHAAGPRKRHRGFVVTVG